MVLTHPKATASAPEQKSASGAGGGTDEQRVPHDVGVCARASEIVERADQGRADQVGCDVDGEEVDAYP